jgi:hypothetical protein
VDRVLRSGRHLDQALRHVLDVVQKRDVDGFFAHPVDVAVVPDYPSGEGSEWSGLDRRPVHGYTAC